MQFIKKNEGTHHSLLLTSFLSQKSNVAISCIPWLGVFPAGGREKKQGATEKLGVRTGSGGKEIGVISLSENLEEFYLSEGDGYKAVDAVRGGGGGFICRYR